MSNLADFSTHAETAPCKRCGEVLSAHVRHCPECGKDQSIADEPGDPSVAPDSVRAALGGESPRVATVTAVLPYDQVQRAMAQEIVPPPPGEAVAFGSAIGFLRPGLYWQQDAQPAGNDRRFGWADRAVAPNRLVIGAMALLVVVLAGALAQDLYANWRREEAREEAFHANVAQMQAALQRGDIGTAQRALGALMLERPDDPAVASLRKALERQLHEAAPAEAPPPRIERAAASMPLAQPGLVQVGGPSVSGPLAQPKHAPADAVPVRTRTVAADDAPLPAATAEPPSPPALVNALVAVPANAAGSGSAAPKKVCSDALAALSLCRKD